MVRIAAVLVALASCTAGQARRVHRAGEVAAAAGIGAMLGSVLAAEAMPDHDQALYTFGRACIPVTVLGALVYAATDRPAPR
jgi:hypothetical protein